MAKKNHFNDSIKLLKEINKDNPNYGLGRIIHEALADYGNFWGISDKEFEFAIEKYKTELEFNIVGENELARIIEEGKNLDKIFLVDEEEEEDEYGDS